MTGWYLDSGPCIKPWGRVPRSGVRALWLIPRGAGTGPCIDSLSRRRRVCHRILSGFSLARASPQRESRGRGHQCHITAASIPRARTPRPRSPRAARTHGPALRSSPSLPSSMSSSANRHYRPRCAAFAIGCVTDAVASVLSCVFPFTSIPFTGDDAIS